MSTNTGGPAFPSKRRIHRAGYVTSELEPVDGMTLRDYFAAKAMNVIYARFLTGEGMAGHWTDEGMAESAYKMADAMLEVRSQ